MTINRFQAFDCNQASDMTEEELEQYPQDLVQWFIDNQSIFTTTTQYQQFFGDASNLDATQVTPEMVAQIVDEWILSHNIAQSLDATTFIEGELPEEVQVIIAGYENAESVSEITILLNNWHPDRHYNLIQLLKESVDDIPIEPVLFNLTPDETKIAFDDLIEAFEQEYTYLNDLAQLHPNIMTLQDLENLEMLRQELDSVARQEYTLAYYIYFGTNYEPSFEEILEFWLIMLEKNVWKLVNNEDRFSRALFTSAYIASNDLTSGEMEIFPTFEPDIGLSMQNLGAFWEYFLEEGVRNFSDVADIALAIKRWFNCETGFGEIALAAFPFVSAAVVIRAFRFLNLPGTQHLNNTDNISSDSLDELLSANRVLNQTQRGNLIRLILADQPIDFLINVIGNPDKAKQFF